MLIKHLIMIIRIVVRKIINALLSAFALVYFRFPGQLVFFWLIFLILMLAVEVKIVLTFKVVARFGILNSYYGLIYRKLSQQLLRFYFTTSLWQFQMKWLKLRELIGLVNEILCWNCNPDEPGKYYGNFCHFIHLWLKPVLVAFVNYNWSRNGHCRYGFETNVSI